MLRRSFIKIFTAAGAALIVPKDSFGLFQSQPGVIGAEDVEAPVLPDFIEYKWLDPVELIADLPFPKEDYQAIVVTGAPGHPLFLISIDGDWTIIMKEGREQDLTKYARLERRGNLVKREEMSIV